MRASPGATARPSRRGRRAPSSRVSAFLAVVAALSATTAARAGGYDTPMLYSARHMGMGGAAVGYVRDPSALFHNPAGLAHVNRVAVLGDVSLLVGGLKASPSIAAQDVDSETTFAPFFLVGGAFRITDFLVAGLGLYPVASSGATYQTGASENTTTLFFLEATPALALNLLENLRFGLGYRVTYVRLERFFGDPERPEAASIDLDLAGYSYAGLRAGLQWTPIRELELGLTYRHVTETKVTSEAGTALPFRATDVSTRFTLPSKLVFGTRWNAAPAIPHAALAADVEYNFNSQNDGEPLRGTDQNGDPVAATNVFEWQNSVTLRVGGEYRVLDETDEHVALRLGYVYDSKTANERYPTAFGTPPSATQVVTAGGGYRTGGFEVNLAYGYRFGGTDVPTEGLAPAAECRFCGYAGDYAINLHGIYADVSYEL